MDASKVAAQLRAAGVTVQGSTEGSDEVDGEVTLTPLVHVQVPTYGTGLGVVQETTDGKFKFHPQRRSVQGLLPDIRKALGLVTA